MTAVQPHLNRTENLSPIQLAAKEYYAMGFSIGPTKPGSKEPHLWRWLPCTRIDSTFIPELFDNDAGIFVITGSISKNLAVLDCENIKSSEHHGAEFHKRGLWPWQVATAFGVHYWWLSQDGELANVAERKFPDGGAEIRGNRLYVLCPPSIHPTGALYEWVYRRGESPPVIPISSLDWLPVNLAVKARRKFELREAGRLDSLSRATRDFIDNGAPERTRNNRLFSAACDLAGNGYSHEEALNILMATAENCGLVRDQILWSIRSAYSKKRTPAKRGSLTVPAPDWMKAQQWAESRHWAAMKTVVTNRNGRNGSFSVSAQTARDVFLAFCERARREHGSERFRASIREVAELANVGSATANRAIKCLVAAQYLHPRGHSAVQAGLYTFGALVLHGNGSGVTQGNIVSICKNRCDAFSRGALGKVAERIWQLLLREKSKAVEIARRLRISRSTVSRSLGKLKKFGMAQMEAGRRWAGNAVEDNYLAEVATKCGTAGKFEQRKQKHAHERSQYVTALILKKKRNWEQNNSQQRHNTNRPKNE